MTETLKSTPVVEQIDLGPLDEFPVGSFKVIDVDSRAIGVLRSEVDELFAVLNHCPHRAAPVCRGRVSGTMLPSKPGCLDYAPDQLVLSCPWHGWEFDLRSGRALGGVSPSRLATFPVEVVAGRVLVSVRRRTPKNTR